MATILPRALVGISVVLCACGTSNRREVASGCGEHAAAGVTEGSIDVAGTARRYLISVPEGFDSSARHPLVFGFHGASFTPETFRTSLFVEGEAAGAAIFVYPEGLERGAGKRGWDLAADGVDVAFFDALIDRLTSSPCVDPARVFAFGRSVGGYMTNALGCARADRIRAIAPTISGGPSGACEGTVSAWIANNEDDPAVDFAEGEATRDHWTAANGCDATWTPVEPAPCVEMQGCDAGRRVVWCASETGGHEPPDFAAQQIWSFFAGF